MTRYTQLETTILELEKAELNALETEIRLTKLRAIRLAFYLSGAIIAGAFYFY